MKKTIMLSIAAIVASVNLSAADTAMTKKELANVKSEYSKVLRNPSLKLDKGIKKANGIEVIQLSANTPYGVQKGKAFVIPDKGVIVFGEMFTKDGKKVSMPKDVKLIKESVMVTYGNGPTEIYVVSDPECPWCQRLETNIDTSKYTIHLIPFPLAMHKNSRAVLYWILAGKDSKEVAKRFHDHMTKQDKGAWKNFKPTAEQKAKFDKIIEKGLAAGQELEVRGTPSVFDKDMNSLNNQQMSQLMQGK